MSTFSGPSRLRREAERKNAMASKHPADAAPGLPSEAIDVVQGLPLHELVSAGVYADVHATTDDPRPGSTTPLRWK